MWSYGSLTDSIASHIEQKQILRETVPTPKKKYKQNALWKHSEQHINTNEMKWIDNQAIKWNFSQQSLTPKLYNNNLISI